MYVRYSRLTSSTMLSPHAPLLGGPALPPLISHFRCIIFTLGVGLWALGSKDIETCPLIIFGRRAVSGGCLVSSFVGVHRLLVEACGTFSEARTVMRGEWTWSTCLVQPLIRNCFGLPQKASQCLCIFLCKGVRTHLHCILCCESHPLCQALFTLRLGSNSRVGTDTFGMCEFLDGGGQQGRRQWTQCRAWPPSSLRCGQSLASSKHAEAPHRSRAAKPRARFA